MSLEERSKATAKNVEGKAEGVKERVKATATNVAGKVEEAVGNATDNPAKVAKGKAKQAEADMRNAKEDLR